jgi:hypothetical protein
MPEQGLDQMEETSQCCGNVAPHQFNMCGCAIDANHDQSCASQSRNKTHNRSTLLHQVQHQVQKCCACSHSCVSPSCSNGGAALPSAASLLPQQHRLTCPNRSNSCFSCSSVKLGGVCAKNSCLLSSGPVPACTYWWLRAYRTCSTK